MGTAGGTLCAAAHCVASARAPHAGKYTFSGNLNLPSNVVIRGEPTKGAAKRGTSPGDLSPETVLECPARRHNGIFNNDPDAKNLGVIGVGLSVRASARRGCLRPARLQSQAAAPPARRGSPPDRVLPI